MKALPSTYIDDVSFKSLQPLRVKLIRATLTHFLPISGLILGIVGLFFGELVGLNYQPYSSCISYH